MTNEPTIADLAREIASINEKLRVLTATPAGRDYEIIQRLKRAETQRTKPEPPSFFVTGENAMALEFSVQTKAAPTPSDIVKGILSVTVAGNPLPDLEVGAEAALVRREDFVGKDNDQVDGSLRYVDDQGNVGPATTFTGTLTDIIAPPAPGELGLVVTSETFDEPV